MSILATSAFVGLLPLLLVLAFPLMMIFMMRGGHGHAGHGSAAGGHSCQGGGEEPAERTRSRATMSLEELKRERDELNALIGERAEEAVEARR